MKLVELLVNYHVNGVYFPKSILNVELAEFPDEDDIDDYAPAVLEHWNQQCDEFIRRWGVENGARVYSMNEYVEKVGSIEAERTMAEFNRHIDEKLAKMAEDEEIIF